MNHSRETNPKMHMKRPSSKGKSTSSLDPTRVLSPAITESSKALVNLFSTLRSKPSTPVASTSKGIGNFLCSHFFSFLIFSFAIFPCQFYPRLHLVQFSMKNSPSCHLCGYNCYVSSSVIMIGIF